MCTAYDQDIAPQSCGRLDGLVIQAHGPRNTMRSAAGYHAVCQGLKQYHQKKPKLSVV